MQRTNDGAFGLLALAAAAEAVNGVQRTAESAGRVAPAVISRPLSSSTTQEYKGPARSQLSVGAHQHATSTGMLSSSLPSSQQGPVVAHPLAQGGMCSRQLSSGGNQLPAAQHRADGSSLQASKLASFGPTAIRPQPIASRPQQPGQPQPLLLQQLQALLQQHKQQPARTSAAGSEDADWSLYRSSSGGSDQTGTAGRQGGQQAPRPCNPALHRSGREVSEAH